MNMQRGGAANGQKLQHGAFIALQLLVCSR